MNKKLNFFLYLIFVILISGVISGSIIIFFEKNKIEIGVKKMKIEWIMWKDYKYSFLNSKTLTVAKYNIAIVEEKIKHDKLNNKIVKEIKAERTMTKDGYVNYYNFIIIFEDKSELILNNDVVLEFYMR